MDLCLLFPNNQSGSVTLEKNEIGAEQGISKAEEKLIEQARSFCRMNNILRVLAYLFFGLCLYFAIEKVASKPFPSNFEEVWGIGLIPMVCFYILLYIHLEQRAKTMILIKKLIVKPN